MRKDFGTFLLLGFCLILAISTWTDYKGYSGSVSDWSKIGHVDYATNRYCYWYYHRDNKVPEYFRLKNTKNIAKDLYRCDSLIVGLDYYALMGVCYGMIPPALLNKYGRGLRNGRVYRFEISLVDSLVMWKDLN